MMLFLVFRDELEVAFDLSWEMSWLLFCIFSCVQIPRGPVEGEIPFWQFSYVRTCHSMWHVWTSALTVWGDVENALQGADGVRRKRVVWLTLLVVSWIAIALNWPLGCFHFFLYVAEMGAVLWSGLPTTGWQLLQSKLWHRWCGAGRTADGHQCGWFMGPWSMASQSPANVTTGIEKKQLKTRHAFHLGINKIRSLISNFLCFYGFQIIWAGVQPVVMLFCGCARIAHVH